jgi:hypothetical protein
MFFLVLELASAFLFPSSTCFFFYLPWNFLTMPLNIIVVYSVAPKQKWKRKGRCHRTGLAWGMWKFQFVQPAGNSSPRQLGCQTFKVFIQTWGALV